MMENKNPFFSIIIPTYNHGHFIKRCIDSLIAQTYTHWEAIIVNNFSKDNTIDVIKEYQDPRIHLVNNANNGVIAVSRNKGIELSQGDWICFLDSDDWWTPNKLEMCLPYMDDYDFIHHNLILKRDKKTLDLRRKICGRNLKNNFIDDLLVNGNAVKNSSVLIRKSLVDIIGPISEDKELVGVEDFDYWIRVFSNTKNVLYLPYSLGFYWMGNNISSSLNQINKEEAIYCKYKCELSNDKYRKLSQKNLNYIKARIFHKSGFFNEAIGFYIVSLSFFTILKSLRAISGLVLCMLRLSI